MYLQTSLVQPEPGWIQVQEQMKHQPEQLLAMEPEINTTWYNETGWEVEPVGETTWDK